MANQIKYKVGFDVDNKSLKSLQDQLLQLQKMTSKDFMKINPGSSLSQAQKELQQIKKTARQVDEALDRAFSSKLGTINLTDFKRQLKGLNIDKIYSDFSKMGATGQAAFRSLSTQMMTVNTRIRQSHSLLDKMATTLGNTLKWNIASNAINGISRSVEQAWGYVKSLDGSLNDIRIVTGKSSDEMARFAEQANSAAKSLGKTTTDYTKASLIYAQQGLNDEEVAARAAITLKAANVTGQSTDDVSEQLTAVWNGYKVTADQAELYVDRLAAVAATTASDLEELSTGMSKVASAAAAMGVGEDQLAAQLSTIISVTKQAPESVGTALRTVYARISDIKAGIDEDGVTLGNYSGKMKELGFNVLDAAGNIRDMGEVMEQIGGRWQDLTREQQINLAQTMAGQRQYNNLLALFDNFEAYNQALNIAQNAAGTLQQQQDIYMESTAAHLNALKASVEDAFDSFMNKDSLDSVNSLIDALADGETAIAGFIDSLGGGMNILSSLGSLGVTVFSKQIAGSIQTTINNLNRGREQAQAFQTAINNAEQLQNKGYGNDYTQKLINDRAKIVNMGQRLPAQQFDQLQQGFNKITVLANQVEKLDEKEKKLLKTYEALKPVMKQILADHHNSIEATLEDQGAIEDLTVQLKSLSKAYASVVQQQQKLNKEMQSRRAPNRSRSELALDNKQIKSDMTEYINRIKSNKTDTGKSIYDSLSAEQKQIIDQAQSFLPTVLNTKMKGSTKEALQQQSIQLEDFFAKIKEIIVQGRADVLAGLQGVENDTLNKTRQEKQKKEEEKKDEQNQQKDKIDNAEFNVRIQNYVKLAGGIAQVGSAIQQVQNLGSIWTNDDLSTGQKILQIITNAGMTFPLLINGLKQVLTVTKLVSLATKEQAVAAGLGTMAEGAHAVAIKLVGTEAGKTAVMIRLLDTSFKLTGVGLAIGILAAAATAIAIIVGHMKKLHEQTIENAKADIEEANKKQQLIDKNKELYNSVQQLNNQYQNGEITRAELRSSIQDLIEQYNIEDEHIISLITRYDDLTEAIQRLREEAAKEEFKSAKSQAQDVEDLMIEQAKDNGRLWKDSQGQQKFSTSISTYGLTEESKQIIKDMGGVYDQQKLAWTITVDADAQHIMQVTDAISKMKESYQEMSAAERADSKAYGDMNDYLTGMSQSTEAYTNNVKKLNAAIVELNGNSKDFSNIDTFAKYQQARQAMIDNAKGNKDFTGDETDAALEVDKYLSTNQIDLFNQFDEAAQQLDAFKEKFGESNQQIETLIKNLSEEDLKKFVQLNPDIVTDWDQLLYILQRISKIDLKNVTEIGDVQSRQRENLDKFKKYDEVKQSVSQGKEIKDADYDELPQTLQQFFTYAGDGMWKLANDAKGFYDAIESQKLKSFQDTLSTIGAEFERNQKIAEGNFDYGYIKQSSIQNTYDDQGHKTGIEIDQSRAQAQLNYLKAAVDINSQEGQTVQYLQEQLEAKQFGIEQARQLDELISQTGDKTQNLTEKNEELKRIAQETYQQIHDAMFPVDEDVDQKKLQALSDQLQKLAENSEILSEDLESNGRAAKDVAQGLLRFSDATKDVADNYDDWMKALSSDSLGDQAEAIAGLRDAYADLLDFPEDAFSDQFLTSADNLNLLKEAANGSTEAYDQLMQAAQQDIATQVGLDTTAFDDAFNALMDQYYQGQNLDDMQIGASLNDEGFLQGLTDMVNAANMSAEQATAYLASMGVDAEVIEQDNEAEESSETMDYQTEVTGHQHVSSGDQVLTQSGPFMVQTPVQQRVTGWEQKVKAIPNPTKTKKQNKSFALKVTSAKKSSGGGFKYSNAPGKKSPSKKGGGGGGGKGGGGGGGSKPDTSKKDAKKPLKSDKDPYHDINIKLRDINDQLEKMEKHQERLWGKQAFDNLNKQNKLLEDQLDALKEKNKIQRQELSKQRKNLQGRGVTFDTDGNISNYTSILQQQENKVQAMYDQYNKWVKKYNESTDADYKKGISEAMSNYDKQIKEEEEKLKELKSDIDKYDKTQEEIQKNLDEQDETNQKIIENNIKKFRMQVEIRLDMGKAERDWNEFRRNVLEKTDVLKGTEFDNIFGDASQNFSDLFSYFNVHGSMGTVEKLTNQLHGTLEQLQQIDKTGTSAIYGDNKAQAMEDLQDDLEELMDQMKDIEGLIDDIDQAYLDTIDDIQDQFDKQIEDYEYVQQLLENDMDLLTLLYGDKNYEAMQKYYDQMYQNNLKQLDSLRQQREFWKQEWDAAVARGDTNAAKKFEQNYKNAISNINSLIKDSIENLQDSYSNAVAGIFYNAELQLTNGKGFDYLQTEWDLINKNADQYLDTVNAAFAIQDTQRKYQNALNDTKNIKNQQALKKLMDQQLNILRSKEKLTQYDIDRAQKLLEIEQARIALEDARSAKTSMRLKRDSQGNYSYEYYADEEGIGEAEQDYANAQNDLYNFDLDKTKQTTNEILSAWQEFKDKYKEIMLDVTLSDEERHEKLKLLQDQYGEYFNLKTEQLANVRLNLMDSAFKDLASLYNTDVENYNGMADAEKDILMGNIVPTWKNGVVEMAQIMAGEGGLLPVCQDAFDDLDETTKEYQDDLQELAVAAGVDFDDIQNGIDDTANDLSDLIETNDELISRMSDELLAITLLKDQAHRLMEEYQNVKNAAIDAVNQIHNYIQAQQAQAADYIANQKSMADAQSNAYMQVADAYVAAINRIQAAIAGASSSGSGGGGGGGGGSNDSGSPSDTSSKGGYNNPWIGGYGGSDIRSFSLIERNKKRSSGGGSGRNTMMYYASGGYTGDWNSDEGRIAVLHEKELVLNKEDTANMLDAVKIIRSLNDNVSGKAYDINASLTNGKTQSNDNKETIEQDVHITATFPNVNTKKEIEEAFSELANRAAQRVLKR